MSLPIAPKGGTENYPHDWDGIDVPDWISATCAVCGEDIEWDPRNLWVHSDGEPTIDNPWDSPYAGGPPRLARLRRSPVGFGS